MKLVKRSNDWMTPWISWPSFFDDSWLSDLSSASGVNMWEDDDKVYIEVAVPGMDEDDVDVSLENGLLTVRAVKESKDEKREKGKKVYSSSMRSNFYYSTTLPGSIDPDTVDASLDKGVLTVTVDKSEKAKPRKIQVKKKS